MKEYIKGTLIANDIKRLCVDMKFQMNCPNKCGKILIHDFKERYLSFPEVGDKKIINLYCEECDDNDAEHYEWTIASKIISMDVVVAYDPMDVTSD
jgi:hypothetical protein